MHPILQTLTATTGSSAQLDAAAVLEHFQQRTLKRGEHWLREGEVCRRIAFLERGMLRHTRVDATGKRTTRWATLPGQFAVNLPSFTQQSPSDDAIEAAEECVIHEIDRAAWEQLRNDFPVLQQFWVSTLEYLITCFEDRVYSLISGDAEHRYQYMMERYPDFLLQLPQHYVADMLGIAPRHLSRIRKAAAEQ